MEYGSRKVKPETYRKARENRTMMSPFERKLWEELRGHQLAGFKFRRQHPIGEFIVDFYCPAKHLAIEVDGDSHADQVAYDTKRTAILQKNRCTVIRFTNQQVHDDIEGVLSEIEKVLNG